MVIDDEPTAAAAVPAGGDADFLDEFDSICDALADVGYIQLVKRLHKLREPIRKLHAPAPSGGVTEAMVNRFLGWPLPDTVNPDGTYPAGEFRKKFTVSLSGTNLLDATEARAMLEYVLQTPPSAQAQGPSGLTVIASTADFAEAWEKYKAALADLHAHLEARIAALKSEAADKPVASS